MTQDTVKTYFDEIKRWAAAPDGTKVWFKKKGSEFWEQLSDVDFNQEGDYVVDDRWAELRIAYKDGKQILFRYHGVWEKTDFPTWNSHPSNYKIAEESAA